MYENEQFEGKIGQWRLLAKQWKGKNFKTTIGCVCPYKDVKEKKNKKNKNKNKNRLQENFWHLHFEKTLGIKYVEKIMQILRLNLKKK